jgi:predicted Zn-dependent peptidase
MSGIKRTELDNGLVLLTEQIPHKEKATILIGAKVGSIDEPLKINGASHFNEHLLFKRNKYRTTKEISRDLERDGTSINAFTSNTMTVLLAKALPDKINSAANIFYQCVNNFNYDSEEFTKEKEVILSEVKMHTNNPLIYINDFFYSHLFQGTVLEQPIGGSLETMSAVTKEELENFKKEFYITGNMAITVVGNFPEKELEQTIQETFGSLKKHDISKNNQYIPVKNVLKEIIQPRKGVKNEAYFKLGWRVPGKEHEDFYNLSLIKGILSAGMSSRIFEELREKRGIGYAVGAGYESFKDIGSLNVYAFNFDPNRIDETKNVVLEQCHYLKEHLVTDEELERTRNLITSAHIDGMDDLFYRAIKLLETEFYKLSDDFREFPKHINAITKEQLRETSNKYFDDNFTMTVLVPPAD